MNLKKWEGIYE